MKTISIAWREGTFRCEYQREPEGGWFLMFSGDELLARERVGSMTAAYRRARELGASLESTRAKRA